jgi:hypothetical protein
VSRGKKITMNFSERMGKKLNFKIFSLLQKNEKNFSISHGAEGCEILFHNIFVYLENPFDLENKSKKAIKFPHSLKIYKFCIASTQINSEEFLLIKNSFAPTL